MTPYNHQTKDKRSAGFEIISSGVTHTGHVRSKNEDSILLLDEESVWVIADGMGGHQAGDFASHTIVKNLGLFKAQESLENSVLLLEENLLNSNAIIREKSNKLGENATIGSTVICAYIWQNFLFSFWAGDSRLYRYRGSKLERLTEDHSYVEELVRMGKIEAQDAEAHPAANVVLRAVGIDDELCIDFDYFELAKNDIFILCSDGLYKDVDANSVASIIAENPDDMMLLNRSLLTHALEAGGSDNTSIITLKVIEKTS